jgi:hypothetical protein
MVDSRDRQVKLATSRCATPGGEVFGTTVDTAIGLVLIFFLFSVLVSTAMEVISGYLALRSRALENAFAKLIENPENVKSGLIGIFGAHVSAAAAADLPARADVAANAGQIAGPPTPAPATASPPTTVRPLVQRSGDGKNVFDYKALWDHPLVGGASGNNRPSYVSAVNFGAALIAQLTTLAGSGDFETTLNGLPAGRFKDTLLSLYKAANKDMDAFRTGIETWFDSAMDRLSGEYKRFTQVITFVMALALAVWLNVDALNVARVIYAQPALQASLSAAAAKQVAAGGNSIPPDALLTNAISDFNAATKQVQAVAPIGWPANGKFVPQDVPGIVWTDVWGWVLTAFAAMLGGPFWFGILQTLVNARSAGPKPKSSTASDD